MIFLVLVPSPPYVAIRRRELLPRGFTLTLAGGLFSVTAFIRLLPSVLSTARCPSCPDFPHPKARQVVLPILFITELALELVVLSIDLLYSLHEARSDVFAMLVALHGLRVHAAEEPQSFLHA